MPGASADAGLSGLVMQQLGLQQQQPLLPADEVWPPASTHLPSKGKQGDQAVEQLLQEDEQEGSDNEQQQQQRGRLQQVDRLSAVIIDSAKIGRDGGEPMRRAVRNLPGGCGEPFLSVCSYRCSRHCKKADNGVRLRLLAGCDPVVRAAQPAVCNCLASHRNCVVWVSMIGHTWYHGREPVRRTVSGPARLVLPEFWAP